MNSERGTRNEEQGEGGFSVFRNPKSEIRNLKSEILLLLLVLLFFNKMAFSNLILARGDVFLYFYPYWAAAADALQNGRFPLWNPHLFMGAPLLANSQVGFFYPLNWPVWWLLPTPYAVSASIVLHVAIAGWGAYLAGRRALGLGRLASWFTAVLFALGGYLTAQVEHVNQVQGLAWLPWFLVVLPHGRITDWRDGVRRGTAVALLFALQLLAGHTQTAFISGVAVGIWVVVNAGRLETRDWRSPTRQSLVSSLQSLLPVFLAVALALLLTAVQLLPTLELTGLSARQGGLPPNEVLSFSWHPLLMGRSLLPSVGQALFSEYVAFLPITALVLAVLGAGQWRRRPGVLAALLLTGVGLFLALGLFNPLYWLLARLPGFDLFRVPARWLVLYALGAALLAGVGVEDLGVRSADFGFGISDFGRRFTAYGLRLKAYRLQLTAYSFVLLLIGWTAVAGFLVRWLPTGPEAPWEWPSWGTWLLWLVELAVVGWLLWRRPSWGHWVWVGTAVVVLFLASRSLPYNNLTTPEAWFDVRPPAARLISDFGFRISDFGGGSAEGGEAVTASPLPPDRLLSLSAIFFDPGDWGEIEAMYAGQLPAAALYDYVVAIKQKEIIAPNLPLAYGLASVDGFDGGVLPLRTYSALMSLILPAGEVTTDGRLREHLTAVPDAKWLDLFNGRYLITDKTGDQWRSVGAAGSVFFDGQHAAAAPLPIAYLPDFPATALAVLSEGTLGRVALGAAGDAALLAQNGDLSVWALPESVSHIELAPGAEPWRIVAATLVNEADGTFMPLALGNYRLIHSGDVKIYENLDVLPRAFLLADWQWQPDETAVLTTMAAPDFDPRRTAVLLGEGQPPISTISPIGEATILSYAPERVVVHTEAAQERLLLLTDAHYPGWTAMLDGQPAPIHTTDALFRGVFVPAGAHEVVFAFRPASVANGRWLSLLGWLLLVGCYIGASHWFAPTRR